MAPIDVEKAIDELTLGEKVALTAGKLNFHSHNTSTFPISHFCPHQPPPSNKILITQRRTRLLAHSSHSAPEYSRPAHVRWPQWRPRYPFL